MSNVQPTSQPPQVLKQRYYIQHSLGKGRFGTVYLVKDLQTSEEKVVKWIALDAVLKQDDDMPAVLAEAQLQSKLNHPNVVSYYDSFIDNDAFYIVCEYCNGGDLRTKIKEQKKASQPFFDERTIIDWFAQLMRAVEHVHQQNIIHRDISTGNVFLKNNLIKLGDFGSSRVLRSSLDVATSFIGTPLYMSPEMLNLQDYNSKTDIWSCGCVLYELCTLETLFTVQGVISLSIEAHTRIMPHLPADRCSAELDRVFQVMVAKDQHVRASASDVLRTLVAIISQATSDIPRRRRRKRRRNYDSTLPTLLFSQTKRPIDAETQQWFAELDIDKSGFISSNEIRAALLKGEGNSFDAKTIQILFELFDFDKDDTFDLNEFAEIFDFIRQKRNEFEKEIGCSNKMDSVTFASAIETHLGYKFSPEVIRLAIEKFGVDGFIYPDGYLIASAFFKVRDEKFTSGSQSISFDKFVECCLISH